MSSLTDCGCPGADITSGSHSPLQNGDYVTHGPDEEIEDNNDANDISSDCDTTELACLLHEIEDIVNSLYRVSTKSPRDGLIDEEVLAAAAKNMRIGQAIRKLLPERQGADI